MQRNTRTKPSIPRANLATTATKRVPVPSNRSTSNRNRGVAISKVAPKKETAAAPKVEVDTRTAEEVDRSYKDTLARYLAAKESYERSYKRKMNELQEAFGLQATK